MKQVLNNIKVADIPRLLSQLNLDPEQQVNLTIEQSPENILEIMDKIGKKAQEKGLTENKLVQLLVTES